MRHEAGRLGAPLHLEDLKSLANALIDGVRGNAELDGNFFRTQMLVDEAQTVELARRQARDALCDGVVGVTP